MLDINQLETQFAINAVRRAALLVQQVQSQMVTPALVKEDRSPVTVADFAAQALIGSLLARAFPADRVVAEEDAAGLRSADSIQTLAQVARFVGPIAGGSVSTEQICKWIDHGRAQEGRRFWTLDPIDGTKGFLRGDQYAIALALVDSGQVQIGVLGCPNLVEASQMDLHGAGSLVVAARGQGCWTIPLHGEGEFKRLQVSRQESPAEARLLRSFESGHTNVDQIGEFATQLGISVDPLRMDSQAKYAILAAGAGDLLLRLLSPAQPNYKEKIWDQAAGSLILEEAGGCITDLDGKPLAFSDQRSLIHNRGILATNGRLHPAALEALRQIGA